MAEDDVIQLELKKERRRVTKAYQSQQRRRERNLQQLTIACRRVRSLPEDEEISLANEWAAVATLVSYGSALCDLRLSKDPGVFCRQFGKCLKFGSFLCRHVNTSETYAWSLHCSCDSAFTSQKPAYDIEHSKISVRDPILQ
jgi:hypothetical protein